MESKLFSIGDIVALKTHPYFDGNTNVIISGDHIMLSPLMIVIEVYKSKQRFGGIKTDIYKYKCTYFSPKSYKFIPAEVDEDDLKLVVKCSSSINKNCLKRGDQVLFKTAGMELGKKKSSLTYEDNSVNGGIGSTVINSLLSFLPPVMQVVDFEPHKSKHALTDKKLIPIRDVPSFDLKFNYFDPTDDKIASYVLPIEALQLIDNVNEETISTLSSVITKNGYVNIKSVSGLTLAKPRNIAYRNGYYYLRAYDYLSNKVEENEISTDTVYSVIKSPFILEVPKFDIAHKPEAATPQFIIKEIVTAVNDASAANAFIRIKYKNRNEQLSYRTIKNYEIIDVKEGALNISYLVGYCLLRKAIRSFRVDRIQNLQQLILPFK
jgi:hypothetical protein